MDAFFAAVEQKRHPEPIGKPVIASCFNLFYNVFLFNLNWNKLSNNC
jgi:hypothetical protein